MITMIVPVTTQSASHELLSLINTTEEVGIVNIPIVQKRIFIWDGELAQGHHAATHPRWDITADFNLLPHNFTALAQ